MKPSSRSRSADMLVELRFAVKRIALAGVVVIAAELFLWLIEVPAPAIYIFGVLVAGGLSGIVFFAQSTVQLVASLAAIITATAVGAVTVCPCTGAHFLFAPPAAFAAYWLVYLFAYVAAADDTSTPPKSIKRRMA